MYARLQPPRAADGIPQDIRPVTAQAAATILGRQRGTIGSWVTRYQVLILGRVDRTTYYDLVDLSIIEREIRMGRPVPATWSGRREIRTNY